MNTSENNHLNLLDLSNEILLIIFNELHMVDVLYSLVGVNGRLDKLVLHPIFIRHLDMTSVTMGSVFDRTFSIDNQVLEKISQDILPRIHHHVTKLAVEYHSMEHFLQTINYPQLRSLLLIDFPGKILDRYLTDHTVLRHLLTEQITHLTIDIQNGKTKRPSSKTLSKIFVKIISSCTCLRNLHFCGLYYQFSKISFSKLSSIRCTSSILTTLKIRVRMLDDCLYLLDGCFDCLSTLIIYVDTISSSSETIDKKKKLPKLQHFSLTSLDDAADYDEEVIPLLRRMVNLEELTLNLLILRIDSTYIDGLQLHDEIIVFMPHLNKFAFNIIADVLLYKTVEIALPSNEDVQRSFIGWRYGEVVSHVEIISAENGHSQHHIYSLPYKFDCFYYVNNTFQGGMFNNVQRLVMKDSRPFECHFFKVISQHFPFLTALFVLTTQPQKEKQQSTILIIFPHLILLNITGCHEDYAEQFLDHNRCHLPCLLNLQIDYETLATVTNNFTNDAIRFTCGQLTRLNRDEPFVRTENFDEYFPLL